uniref:Transcriptional adaptor 2B n=1 Tax=Eptatretus burgeri TaxID=7764 RepID=A0A8C4QCU2_EPTBU
MDGPGKQARLREGGTNGGPVTSPSADGARRGAVEARSSGGTRGSLGITSERPRPWTPSIPCEITAETKRGDCANCAEPSVLHVRCADCVDLDLCPECFSAGAELGSHRRWHRYQVIFTGRACLDVIEEQQQQRSFGTVASEVGMGPMPWSSHEEQLLLEAVEQCGFGNWEEVAAHVGNQTAAEACNHYLDLYVYGNLGHACIPEHIPNRMTDHTCQEGNLLSIPSSLPLPPATEESPSELQQLGYLPLRDDYEVEPDPEAETLISSLSLAYSDEELELELKRACVDMYVQRVAERQQRKHLAYEYGLITIFLSHSTLRGHSTGITSTNGSVLTGAGVRDEVDLRNRLQPFWRFLTAKQLDEMVEGVQREMGLRTRIRELQRYRRDGIGRLAESAEYEAAKLRRERRRVARPPTPTARPSVHQPVPNTRLGVLALRYILVWFRIKN